jgi:glycosyltransferase involved in cell wall biosynthesis
MSNLSIADAEPDAEGQSGVTSPIRVLVVSENISMKMGGESSLPFYYAKLLSRRGAEVWLACHERVENELREEFAEFQGRLHFVKDTPGQKRLYQFGRKLRYRVNDIIVGQAIHVMTQSRLRSLALRIIREANIDVVFEPAPITPKGLSFMYDMGVPVVIGPLCGGMDFPPAFRVLDSFSTRQLIKLGRFAAQLANHLVPGKLHADVLLVANRLTEAALPRGYRGRVIRVFESGVDLELWASEGTDEHRSGEDVRFVFSGRFVDWKGVQYLVPAFARAVAEEPRCKLDLIGGGELESEIRAMIDRLDLRESVRWHGWLARSEAARIVRDADVFVMPSLRECGGTAILEAMALGKPVISTNWGGPADYVDANSGLLVEPSSEKALVDGLAAAMVRLARSGKLRKSLGAGGRLRVLQDDLSWNAKADRVLSILREAAQHRQ